MEREELESEPGDVSKTRKPSRNKLACSIACLDGANFNINIEKNAPGKLLIEKICQHLNVEEKEYFGLLYVDLKTGLKRWLETQKPIKKQLHGSESNFEFAVKFFEPNPEQLKNDYTRYLMALQIREEIATGGLPCSFSAQALLGSYVIQSEFGDYDPLQHGQDYLDGLVFAPEQSVELVLKIKELHKTHKGLTPMEADLQYLEYARKLTLYGVDLHEARDAEGAEIHVGVSFAGIAIYKEQIRTNKFSWPTIEEVKYKGKSFFVKIKPGEYQAFMSTVVFKTPNDRATKELYKSVVEHHTFYRLREPDSPKGGTLPRLHSRFRYSDRTLYQLRQGAYHSLPRPSTLTRRWSDRYSERKRPVAKSEDVFEVEPKVRRDEVPVTSAEPEGTMNEEERQRYRQKLAEKYGVKSGDDKEPPMDVVFTFGACGRNADEVFEKEKDMVSGFLETIKVADTYYGVVEYGEKKANIMARLGDFRNKERLNQYIATIPRSGEGRAIDKGLEKARELLLESGRSDARKALVIFANGKSSARLAELTKEAKPLHDAGVKIIAVGIGDDIDDEELNSITTNKILAQPYDEAAPLGHLLAHEVSEAPSKELVDVTFVMGASGLEGDASFEKQKEIIHSFVDSLKSNDTQMAVVNYAEDDSTIEVKLGEFKDKEDFKSSVDKQKRRGEGKALDKALIETDKVLKQTGRPGVRKAVVVFANGKTGAEIADLAKEARALHDDDVKILAVALGDDVSHEELRALANVCVYATPRDQDSEVTAQNIARLLDMLSEAAEDALDIAFAFGASGSEADAVFKKEKEMINIFIDSLKVHDAQYGVIEYSSDARVHATFGQFSRKERLKAQVSAIERRGEGVGIDKALTSAYDLLMKNGRRGARKVLIVFTSGKANAGVYELRACAKALQDVGVKIVAVAVGNNVDENQLKEVSSDEHVIYSQIGGDSAAVIQLISDDVVSAELTGEAIDIMFALGSAGQEAEMVFEKEKEMLYAFVNSVDTANVRYALIEYAENATLQADFNEHKEKYDFKEFVDSVKRIGEGLGMDKALQRAAAVFENSGRVNAKRVLIVFTNAQSKARTQDLQKYSRELQETGVKVVVVAIGTDVSEEELNNIHAEPVVRTQPQDDVNVLVKSVASDVLATEPEMTPAVPVAGPKLKLDVVFAVGAAGRDANEVFDKEKEIVNSFIDNLKDNDAQFAVIEFGNKASVKSKLGDENDPGKLKASVSAIQRTGDGKCLDKALEQAVQIFQNEARPASNRVLIVLTNAKSNARVQDLKKHAQSLTDAGVKVQVVAVGNDVNEDELLQVTSNELPLLRVQPYEDPRAVISNSAWIVGEKQDEFLDIVFAFGSFGETAEEIFEKEKQLISSFIDSIQKRDTHYGVVEIGPRAKVCAMIGQYRDHVRLKRHVNLVRRSGDATGLDHALEIAAGMFENQARANSRRVLVVFTNGKSGAQAPELQQNSERLTKSNVDIIMVAIGDDVDDDECQYVTCGSHPIINIAPEQNPRAVVYSIVGELEEAKSTEPMDVVFVLGAAGEGADTVYNKNKQIITKFIEANKVPFTMYSLVDYGPKAIVRSKFGDTKHYAELSDQVEKLERPGEGKALDKALEQSVNLLESHGRHDAKKRVIVFSNGNSGANPNHLKKCATLLDDSNVKVVTVAVGDDVNVEELRHINPDEEAVVKVGINEEPESAVFAVARQVQEPCKPKFDIIFAFGAMGNSADMIYLKEKDMIGSFIDSFEFGDYRYGVVEYGTKASVKAKFEDIHGKENLKEFVNSIHRSGEGKALDKALEQSCELFKKHGRHSARKVLIVFTNGKSSGRANELKKHAQILTDMNTKLIVVAVGDDVSVEELLDVTSNEESIVRIQPEDDHQELFASIVSINIEERPITDVDVVFALGASGHHGDEMFEKEKEFVSGFIDSSKHGDMKYAMIQYADPLAVHFRFKDMDDKEKVKDKIWSVRRDGDGTSMAEGLRKANELFTNESRANSHKVLIVMMNGPLGGRAGELRTGAKTLQKSGVKVITVAIGDEVDHDELRQLSCDEDNVIHVMENEDVGSVAYVITHQAVKGTPVHDEVIKEEKFSRLVFLEPRIKFVIKPSMAAIERRREEEDAERKRQEEELRRQEEELRRQEEERLRLEEEKRLEEERLRQEEFIRLKELQEEEERLERERLELEQLERESLELERKQKEEEKERRRKEIEAMEEQKKRDQELEEELVMMPFAVATPEIEDVKKAHRKTLDLEDTFAEKASFLRVSEDANPPPSNNEETNITTETVTVQETTSTVYVNPSTLQDDVRYNRDNTPEIRYSLKTDLNLDFEQGERGFVRDQIRSQETEIKRRSTHDPSLQTSLDKMLKSTVVTTVESSPDNDVFPLPPPEEPSTPPSEIPNVETRTVIYEPNSPSEVATYQMTGDPVVVTRRLKIDTTPVSQTTKTTHVVRHTSTPAQVVTKTITIEGDGEPLTAEELAEIMSMSGSETTTTTTSSSSSFQRVEKVQKVEQVVTSKQFVQSGQSFIVETGDPDADAAIMKALEDARKQDPNVKVAEVTITKQETEDGD